MSGSLGVVAFFQSVPEPLRLEDDMGHIVLFLRLYLKSLKPMETDGSLSGTFRLKTKGVSNAAHTPFPEVALRNISKRPE